MSGDPAKVRSQSDLCGEWQFRGARPGWHVPAPELERTVLAVAQQLLTDQAAIAAAVEQAGIDARLLLAVFTAAHEWGDRLGSAAHAAATLAQLCERIELKHDGIEVALTLPLSAGEERNGTLDGLVLTRSVPMRMRRRGVETRLVAEGTPTAPSQVDLPLLKAVARAYRWTDDLLSGRVPSVDAIARREKVSNRYVHRLIRLGFLAPKIVGAIVDGRHPPNAHRLRTHSAGPSSGPLERAGGGARRRVGQATAGDRVSSIVPTEMPPSCSLQYS